MRVHNLKSVSLNLEPNQLIVFTGVSGSGKSSLAFDTIFTEGQRRYVESLSTYARRYLGDLPRPDADSIEGISPTISIEQKTIQKNPRSTIGTLTGLSDFLRVLFARIATPHCPVSGEPVAPQSRERILQTVLAVPEGRPLIILAPVARNKKGEFREELEELLGRGFLRVRIDGTITRLDEPIALDKSQSHTIDVVIDRVTSDDSSRIKEAVIKALEHGEGLMSFLDQDEETLLSMHAHSVKSGISYQALEPQDFSFNSPQGMCSECSGLGKVNTFRLDKIIDEDLSISEDCCKLASSYTTVRFGNIYKALAKKFHFSVKTPWKKLSDEAKHIMLYGTPKKWTRVNFTHPVTGKRWVDHVRWQGILHDATKRFTEAKSESYRKKMLEMMEWQVCPECQGERLKAYPRAAKLGGKTITEVSSLCVDDAISFFSKLSLDAQEKLIANELVKEILERLQFLSRVGLGYLTLDRTAPTLSGGEAQRVRLASQIGCGLVGVTYILDEPSIGLHPRDNKQLLKTLQSLRDKGNTVIVVEHDEETMRAADTIVDFGPGAGAAGGEIVSHGSVKDLMRSKRSQTAGYLTGKRLVFPSRKPRKPSREKLRIKGAQHHNLKNIDVTIPLGCFVAITGISGSGKSSLISETLMPHLANTLQGADRAVGKVKGITGAKYLDKVISIDQSPIGRNPRSNPATYIKLLDEIRDLFAELPESRARGYKPGRFSFNVKEGSCTTCSGMGQLKVDMDFLEDAYVDCPTCLTKRFDHETLSVRFRERNIADVLAMDVAEGLTFFENQPKIRKKLELLSSVGLDYMHLGQSSTTLSGGEAQRIKLAKELVRPATGRTLYILDEPTTGLHFQDIGHLLKILHQLVEMGNSVVVIEHNIDLIKTADWIIDLGPDGGAGGGEVVGSGSPETFEKLNTPTAEALRVTKHTSVKRKQGEKPTKALTVRGAEQNNLEDVSTQIPLGQITAFTGPSGSGKSSLAFETIYAEGQRRYVESLSPYARQFVKQMSKPKVGEITGLAPAIAIEQQAHAGNPRSTIGTMTEVYDFLRVLYARKGTPYCPETGEKIEAISKETVVEILLGYPEGETITILSPITDDFEKLARLGFMRIRLNGNFHRLDEEIPYNPKQRNTLQLVIDRVKVAPSQKIRLAEAVETASDFGLKTLSVLRESGEEVFFNLSFSVPSTGKSYPEIIPQTFAFNKKEGQCQCCEGLGFIPWDEEEEYSGDEEICPECEGERLNPLARAVKIGDMSLPSLTELPITRAKQFIEEIEMTEEQAKILDDVMKQLSSRLTFLCEVGLGYISLSRSAPTLSGGENQRIRLARQLGSGLTGCLYVLDEPTIGLHPRDNERLVGALQKLKGLGNTLLMVEHDPSTIRCADHIVDFGPHAGKQGGRITAEGTITELSNNPNSLTGAYLSGKEHVAINLTRRTPASPPIVIQNAAVHNLKSINLEIPTGVFNCLSGVSGSGKSTLLHEVIAKESESVSGLDQFRQILSIDQKPLGRTVRSTVGSYVDVLLHLREFFAKLPESIARGLDKRYFSSNHRRGACSNCWGLGFKRIELHFLPPVRVPCEACKGMRLNPLSLEVFYKGLNFGQLLNLTVDEARVIFADHPKITRILDVVISVGLGYLQLGQGVATLSGGEAQRLKLCNELAKRNRGKTLYLLDEPTVGLHPSDVSRLITILNQLVDTGHTLIVIEHNIDMIQNADYVIDLGPDAGEFGGEVVACGTPEELKNVEGSPTGKFL